MTSQLTWKDETMKNSRTIFAGLRCLWNNSSILPIDIKLKLVQSLLCPFLSLSDVITGELNYENFEILKKSFNAMIRFVNNLRKYDHISHLYDSILGLPLKQFLCFRRMVFLYSIIQNKEPSYLYEKLIFFRSNRNGLLIHVAPYQYAFSNNSFFICDIIYWNKLHRDIRNSPTLSQFKEKLRRFLILNN